MKRYRLRQKIDALLLLVALPLVGVALIGRQPLSVYLEFPPRTHYVAHAGFAWPAFIALAVGLLLFLSPFVIRVLRRPAAATHATAPAPTVPANRHPFPRWGWLGLLLTVVAWYLAWTRHPWFADLQIFTFTPIWVGYIVTVNALSYKRTGHCLLKDRPGYMLMLALASAVFWWYFEYLNRFVQNWYYEPDAIGMLSKLQYFIFATLPFATVLPAVLSTRELLQSVPRLSRGLDRFVPVTIPFPRVVGLIGLVTSCIGLAFIGVWPDYLFPLLWLSPLFVLTSLQAIRGQRTLFADLASGDWRNIWLLAIASLICGFFWELWNYHSLARWVYAVPFVGRFKLFEMPILGYAGYLPFGLECAVVADLLTRDARPPAAATAATGRPASAPAAPLRPMGKLARIAMYGNATIIIALAAYFFLIPSVILVRDLADPNLRGPGIPRAAWRLHRHLTPRIARWARERIASGKAGHLNLYDVPATEWPIFGSVYYLWATEALQRAWEQDRTLAPQAPAVYARDAIAASVDLVLDPVHHTWVKTHWGENYMHTENVFFRSLIIAALTSHERLLGTGAHLATLRDQAVTLAAELDASPHGILEDYPGECYPIDVLAAIGCIHRAAHAA